MNWFERVSSYIEDNLDVFIAHFFSASTQITRGKQILLNPSPCCGHNDCFSFSKAKPVGHCFSCGFGGNRIQTVEHVWGKEEGRNELEKWSNIIFQGTRVAQIETEQEKFNRRLQEIYKIVVDAYHHYLVQTEEGEQALQKLTGADITVGQRAHDIETLKRFKVGLAVPDYKQIEKIIANQGFSEEEIAAARSMVWVPPNYYIYPYFDSKGNVIRLNTKPFKRTCLGNKKKDGSGYDYSCGFETFDVSKAAKKEHEATTEHVMSPDVFSTGNKDYALYKDPTKTKKYKHAILVEGENDVQSVEEALLVLPPEYARDFIAIGIGGNVAKGFFELPIFRQFETIYEAFDPDDGGEHYREQLNKEAPDIRVFHLPVEAEFDDIDRFLKSPLELEQPKLLYLLNNAEFTESKELLFERVETYQHKWVARNRSYELHFKIEKYRKQTAQFHGILEIFIDGEPVKKVVGGIDSVSVEATYRQARVKLSRFLEDYYNDAKMEKGKPLRSFNDLIDIVTLTKNYQQVCHQIGWYLYHADGPAEHQRLFGILSNRINNEKTIAEVLKEVNGFSNKDLDPNEIIMPINLTQHFNVANDDAFFYFSRIIRDGESSKYVPCLLTNKKEEIRLDLLKRQDPQSILLIKNKYELPREVPTAIMNQLEVSLQPHWVDKWREGEISEDEIDPTRIIQEIEAFIQRCYYLQPTTRKVLALWIFATYFYMLFKSGFPYLLFTGEKGTGKSTLDTLVYLLSINAKLALDMSESALYRTITFEGGTFILDEVEHLIDKKTVDANGYAKILKGGYSDNAYVYRTNTDKGDLSTDRFSVFGPKVISNINGIEDVIADRCIYVRTYRVEEEKLAGLEDVHVYKEERRHEAHAITSRAVLCALTYYKDVYEIFHRKDSMATGNARLTQILRPLHAIAKFVKGDYEEHLIRFYKNEIKTTKEEISNSTLEGKIKSILKTVAQELTGIEKRKWATIRSKDLRLYEQEIAYNHALGRFEIDNLHLKLLAEELDSEQKVSLKEVHSKVKNLMGPDFSKENWTHTTATLTDENLQKMFDGKRTIKVYRYMLNIQDFLTSEEFNTLDKEGKKSTSLF